MEINVTLSVATEVKNCYHTVSSQSYGLVVKWLSRLPVTEEIAGSNPVEPAKQLLNNTLLGCYFFNPASNTLILARAP